MRGTHRSFSATNVFHKIPGHSVWSPRQHPRPSTPYNLWQTATVRASELFPRNHGHNSGFVVPLFGDSPTRRIGHTSTFNHTLLSVSSVANRGVILQALGLPDHHLRHTTPRFEIGQAVYVSRGSDPARNAFRFDPGTVTAIHHGRIPAWGGYVVKVETFDQPAVTWNAHIEGYERPFAPEELYDRRLHCGAIWIPSALSSLPQPHPNGNSERVFYEEPLSQYLCQRYTYETPQALCDALYDMTPTRREEISEGLQKLCVVGRFKNMEVRLDSLSIEGERFARDIPRGGSYGGTVGEFFREHREDLCHPRWPAIYHWNSEELGGDHRDPVGIWPLENLFVVWPQTLCEKEERTRIAVPEFAQQYFGYRELGEVWRRLADPAELSKFETLLRQRRVAGHFKGLLFRFSNFILQDNPDASECLGPIPSTSSVAHFLHLHSKDVTQKKAPLLLNLDHLSNQARDPLGTWPMETLTVAL